jgi:TOBE-like domain
VNHLYCPRKWIYDPGNQFRIIDLLELSAHASNDAAEDFHPSFQDIDVVTAGAARNLSFLRDLGREIEEAAETLGAAECDPATDKLARVQHLFSAGPVATLSLKLDDGQILDVELSRKQLDNLALDVGDEIAVRF